MLKNGVRAADTFILHLTLDPAIAEFGLETVRLLDPTCGSGHFLLGAFRRLFEARQRHSPGLPVKEHATAALAQVAGADINPYAVAIARFRLVLAYLEAAQIERLRDAPRLSISVVVVDSLLVGANQRTLPLAAHSENAAAWGESHWQLEDRDEALRVFRRQYYHAIVGNPPYKTCKDAMLRDEYRRLYRSCYREFSLAAPFAERFFQLSIDDGFVGLINANSFMKREFGKRLIEEIFKDLDLTHVMDTAGAYIPGHGTPTVLLFGRNRPPLAATVIAVLGKRGEPETPDEPQNGLVWSSVRDHFNHLGFDNEFVSTTQLPRAVLSKHPWRLGGGGAIDLKALLEQSAETRLQTLVDSIGFGCITKQDEVFSQPERVLRLKVEASYIRAFCSGEDVRDWSCVPSSWVIFPYDKDIARVPEDRIPRAIRFMWPFRRVLENRKVFGGETYREANKPWYEFGQIPADRYRSALSIAYAEIATHNHFVLDRGGNVFNQTAPIIKLSSTASEEDHLALLAYLNSSTACFWMKQVFFPKYGAIKADHPDPARNFYQFASTGLAQLPIPSIRGSARETVIAAARELVELASTRAELIQGLSVGAEHPTLAEAFAADWRKWDNLRQRMVFLQDEIDWQVYAAFGLVDLRLTLSVAHPDFSAGRLRRGGRAFEFDTSRTTLVRRDGELLSPDEAESDTSTQQWVADSFLELRAKRKEAIAQSPSLTLMETNVFKRLWRDSELNETEGDYRRRTQRARAQEALSCRLQALLENPVPMSSRQLQTLVDSSEHQLLAAFDLGPLCDVINEQAVPFLSAFRFTEAGLATYAEWDKVWALQRREDCGEKLDVPVPQKYDSKDYRDPIYWRLRGKLDVPKESFISYPGAERDDDPSPLYGWAGWDHLQQATALAGLYHERKTEEAWPPDRLVPLLAGLLELVPWLKQWHNAPTDDLGGEGAGDWYDRYVAAEARSLGKTLDDLRAWRPTSRTARRKTGTR